MKNRQGFLPNILNKYAIRKFSVGTASLLIGATLVMGAGNVARADELDKITTNDGANKDKSDAVDINELTKTEQTDSNVKEAQSNATTEQVDENKDIDSNVDSTSVENNKSSELSDESVNNTATNKSDESSTQSQNVSTTQDNQNQSDEASNETQTQSTNNVEQSKENTTSDDDSVSVKNTTDEKAKAEPTTAEDKETSDTSQTSQSSEKSENKTEKASDTQKETNETTNKDANKSENDDTSSTSKTSDKNSFKESTTDNTSSKQNSVNSSKDVETSSLNDTKNASETTATQSQNNSTAINDKPVVTEADSQSPVPLNNDSTTTVNSQATTSTVRNNRMKFKVLVAVKDGKVVKYKIPSDSKYAYLLQDLGYDATTVKEDTDLRHAGINQMQNADTNVIKLNLSKWLALQNDFVNGGKFNLSFSQSNFFTQIQSITLNGVNMTTTNNGQNWSAPITGSTVSSGMIGSITNHDVLITLKNNQTLKSLGYSNDKPVYLTHTWTENDGSIAEESIQVTTITPTLNSKAPQTTQTSGFTTGRVANKIKYDSSTATINSIHSFKPDENFKQTDYNWVLYIK